MGAVEDAIADGVGDRRIGEEVVPAIVFELTGDDRRAQAVAVVEDLEEVATCVLGEGSDREVVEDEDIHLRDACEETRMGTVGACETELVEEARDAPVQYTKALAAGLMREGAREVALPVPVAPVTITVWCSATHRQPASCRTTDLSS